MHEQLEGQRNCYAWVGPERKWKKPELRTELPDTTYTDISTRKYGDVHIYEFTVLAVLAKAITLKAEIIFS